MMDRDATPAEARLSLLAARYQGSHKPGVLKPNKEWAYVPPVRPEFRLNLDREETTIYRGISILDADERRRRDFPIQFPNRYPSKRIEEALASAIAAKNQLDPSHVLIGNGVMSLMTYVYDIYAPPGSAVAVPTPGFWPAYTYALQRGCSIWMPHYDLHNSASLRRSFEFPASETHDALRRGVTICYLCNPNNPTGTLIPDKVIAELALAFPNVLFIVDEAYGPFAANHLDTDRFELDGARTLLMEGCPNIVVARTFSKTYALANFRIGYVLSHPNNISTIRSYMGPYDLDELSLAMAYYNFNDDAYMRQGVRDVTKNKVVYEQTLERHGVAHYGGYRNSLLVYGLAIGHDYEASGIAVRSMVYQEGIPNSIAQTFRITIPADAENFKFLLETSERILPMHPRQFSAMEANA